MGYDCKSQYETSVATYSCFLLKKHYLNVSSKVFRTRFIEIDGVYKLKYWIIGNMSPELRREVRVRMWMGELFMEKWGLSFSVISREGMAEKEK